MQQQAPQTKKSTNNASASAQTNVASSPTGDFLSADPLTNPYSTLLDAPGFISEMETMGVPGENKDGPTMEVDSLGTTPHLASHQEYLELQQMYRDALQAKGENHPGTISLKSAMEAMEPKASQLGIAQDAHKVHQLIYRLTKDQVRLTTEHQNLCTSTKGEIEQLQKQILEKQALLQTRETQFRTAVASLEGKQTKLQQQLTTLAPKSLPSPALNAEPSLPNALTDDVMSKLVQGLAANGFANPGAQQETAKAKQLLHDVFAQILPMVSSSSAPPPVLAQGDAPQEPEGKKQKVEAPAV